MQNELHLGNANLATLASERARLVGQANFQLMSRGTLTVSSSLFRASVLEEARHEHWGVDVRNERLGVHVEGGEGAREPRRRCRGLGILLLQLPRIRSRVSRVHRPVLFPELSSLLPAGILGAFRGPVESLVCFRLLAAPSLKLPSLCQAVLSQAYGSGVATNAATRPNLATTAGGVAQYRSAPGELRGERTLTGTFLVGLSVRRNKRETVQTAAPRFGHKMRGNRLVHNTVSGDKWRTAAVPQTCHQRTGSGSLHRRVYCR